MSRNAVDSALDHALLMGLVTLPRLTAQLDHSSGRGKRGTQILREILAGRDPIQRPSETELERRFFRILKRQGILLPTAQFSVDIGWKLPARIDFAYPERKIAIETDGYIWHGGKVRWLKDAERSNRLVELGWRVLRLTWKDITEQPDTVAERIGNLLASQS